MSQAGGEPPQHDDLIERARRREEQAWTEIWQHFSGAMVGWFYHQLHNREQAEDMASDVFIEAMRAADRFHGTFSDLRSWLFRIGRNNLIDHRRRQGRATMEAIENADPSELVRAAPSEDPEDMAIARLDRQRLLDAVQRLSSDQREVVLLRLTAGLSSPEIAAIVGKTVGAVKALQHRALGALAKALGDEER
jgi:RNA polymerase sigma-70 factor (ECF subfamily)